jgi:hypothetical protein
MIHHFGGWFISCDFGFREFADGRGCSQALGMTAHQNRGQNGEGSDHDVSVDVSSTKLKLWIWFADSKSFGRSCVHFTHEHAVARVIFEWMVQKGFANSRAGQLQQRGARIVDILDNPIPYTPIPYTLYPIPYTLVSATPHCFHHCCAPP